MMRMTKDDDCGGDGDLDGDCDNSGYFGDGDIDLEGYDDNADDVSDDVGDDGDNNTNDDFLREPCIRHHYHLLEGRCERDER